MPKNNAQEFFKTLFTKLIVFICDLHVNQVFIVTGLRIFQFDERVDCNGANNDNPTLDGFDARLFFNN